MLVYLAAWLLVPLNGKYPGIYAAFVALSPREPECIAGDKI